MKVGNQLYWLSSSVLKIDNNSFEFTIMIIVLFLYFRFSYLSFSLAGNLIVYTPGQCTNRDKYPQKVTSKWGCRLWREMNIFPSISYLIGRVLTMFRQRIDGPNPVEMDSKVFIPAPTFCLQTENVYSINGKVLNISLVRKKKKNTKCIAQNW